MRGPGAAVAALASRKTTLPVASTVATSVVAETLDQRAQVGHRHPLGVADVDAPQERDPRCASLAPPLAHPGVTSICKAAARSVAASIGPIRGRVVHETPARSPPPARRSPRPPPTPRFSSLIAKARAAQAVFEVFLAGAGRRHRQGHRQVRLRQRRDAGAHGRGRDRHRRLRGQDPQEQGQGAGDLEQPEGQEVARHHRRGRRA